MKPILFQLAIGAIAFQFIASTETPPERNTEQGLSREHYAKAKEALNRGNFKSALDFLDRAFTSGFGNPMHLIKDRGIQALIDQPEYRGQFRQLLERHATESHATLVRVEEPGERISVLGRILDIRDGSPITDASIELVHADKNGRYFDEASMWNPRIFAYLKSNQRGEFRIETIQPGPYLDDSGELSYSHIHFAISSMGFRTYRSEFTFEDDPVLTAQGNPDEVPIARLKSSSGKKHYQVIIRLQNN